MKWMMVSVNCIDSVPEYMGQLRWWQINGARERVQRATPDSHLHVFHSKLLFSSTTEGPLVYSKTLLSGYYRCMLCLHKPVCQKCQRHAWYCPLPTVFESKLYAVCVMYIVSSTFFMFMEHSNEFMHLLKFTVYNLRTLHGVLYPTMQCSRLDVPFSV